MTKMGKDNWMKFIESIWAMIGYWQWLQLFKENSDSPRSAESTANEAAGTTSEFCADVLVTQSGGGGGGSSGKGG
jgi:hypothetical protein